jgi:uncharacterized protein
VSDDALQARIQAYLEARSVATLATSGEDGPWAAAVFYVSRGFTLYFLSSPTSRHCRNLDLYPRVAAAIHEDTSDWQTIKGVQLEGTAAEIDGEEQAEARRLYGAKFPLVGSPDTAPAPIAEAMARVRWYRVVPDRLFFIDNAAGFGHRDELTL